MRNIFSSCIFKNILTFFIGSFLFQDGFAQNNVKRKFAVPNLKEVPSEIAFGSCLNEKGKLEVLSSVENSGADLFLLLGDNVYADTINEKKLRRSYRTLKSSEEYTSLSSKIPVLGIWDDHDYGINDGGSEHPEKEMSQRVFQDFFNVPKDSPLRQRKGVYSSYMFRKGDKSLKLILLDTRYFRSKLTKRLNKKGKTYYVKDSSPEATVLGSAQWAWLEEELKKPSTVTVVASSIQVLSNEHRFEKWDNFPLERKRLLELLENGPSKVNVILSGDRHFSEVSKYISKKGRSIYEITSSGLNRGAFFGKYEDHKYRIDYLGGDSFAKLSIDWKKDLPKVTGKLFGSDGKVKKNIEFKF